MSVIIKGASYVSCKNLAFGDPFFYGGLLYVRTRPTGTQVGRYNCVGVGHDGYAYLWDEGVIPAAVTARPEPCAVRNTLP